MSARTHTPRPTDIVALVTFDDREYPNLAVTREHIGRPPTTPHLFGPALEQWLRRGRRSGVDVRGRQIHSAATARLRSGAPGLRVWEIDTLIKTGDPDETSVQALLEQAALAATAARVATVILRTYADHAVLEQPPAPASISRGWSARGTAHCPWHRTLQLPVPRQLPRRIPPAHWNRAIASKSFDCTSGTRRSPRGRCSA